MREENRKIKSSENSRSLAQSLVRGLCLRQNGTACVLKPRPFAACFSIVILLALTALIIIYITGITGKTAVGSLILKGWIAVCISALMAFFILYCENNRIKVLQKRLQSEYEKRLKYAEHHDQLTGLFNRMALKERMSTLIGEKGRRCAILLLDIDNFKYVNDAMGHTYGDLLLKSIGQRLSGQYSGTASFYRLGGDEFIILIEEYVDLADVREAAVQVLNNFKKPVEINNNSIFITMSIGIAMSPIHGTGMDDLMKNADMAVNKAKETGKNTVIFYNELMNETVNERMLIEKYLHSALENREFELYYQPQLNICNRRITGFEALLRWKSPVLGFVSPLKFIDIAEDTHLIIPIGSWVLSEACRFLKKLHMLGFEEVSVSVNISMLQLLQEDFVEMTMGIINSTGVKPGYLELEITETILMKSYEVIAGKLEFLREKGIKIALDDFGKGYSSLNYLRQLPISTLKIDKSFIDMINIENKNKSLTDLIVKAGKRMDLCVIAEGVETQEQMDYLMKYQCNKIQGYLFSKPLSEKEAADRLILNMKEVGV